MDKRTKILATIGPASDSIEIIEGLVKAGVNAFRMNFSHGDHGYHKSNLEKIKDIEKKLNKRIGIFQDISGPKVRVKTLKEMFKLNSGDKLIFVKDEIVGEKISEKTYRLCINHPEILELIKNGEYIYLCDGAIRAKVDYASKDEVHAILENSGILTSNKGVNFPNTKLNIDVITKKDELDLEWGAKNGVHFVAVSFVQKASDVLRVKRILENYGSKARVFAKIEKFDAVENIDEIIKVSDGIMVARGDLGIEVPYYEVPNIQKMIIKKANLYSKPVITATQMMLSMTQNERATRAEISDVANAVLDGTDAVMLSEESAVGKHPVKVVEAMSNTIKEIEKIYPYYKSFDAVDETDMVAYSSVSLAKNINARAILSITGSGRSAIKMARNRPETKIYAISHDEETAHFLTLAWGVSPVIVKDKIDVDFLIADTIKEAFEKGYIDLDHTYIMTAGFPTGVAGSTNYIRIIKKDQIKYYQNIAKNRKN
ncbi:pyruvate kinase [Campylobacter ureolyticus]|uniref:Pyruvate kinase n=1 Tax=Campylobacter ureolyticus TaxID=827 RepID=A0A9Q4KK59_9BACT|nr:pyruvate kinase [Campylobacter ureolyticus]MCZ6117471.1 pyruvate kinase [Campylobacter ureolyticus]MCZ6134479.1 pyruvate kinase [Campylobacter ureolyticus]MCZ6159450.1 pyruvate kinase [Campylobacter ureolyticus]MCZ6160994.1 pyruvate kinase [Campylobacter ureolyticus]MCZ6163645.1 pyruvate kinase [Campylobacter ureolyticus]